MYVLPVGNQIWGLDRDEKRIGKYIETKEEVPPPYAVSRTVRRVSVSLLDAYQEKSQQLNENIKYARMEDWLGKNVDMLV
ncbi:MAG: hypothetical protein LBK61_10895 [Spirochaetaceae bacterium]|jgi:hypothetical protein|nr:hypothetical protein [Spirochaetaceae bacterium]